MPLRARLFIGQESKEVRGEHFLLLTRCEGLKLVDVKVFSRHPGEGQDPSYIWRFGIDQTSSSYELDSGSRHNADTLDPGLRQGDVECVG